MQTHVVLPMLRLSRVFFILPLFLHWQLFPRAGLFRLNLQKPSADHCSQPLAAALLPFERLYLQDSEKI
ncbi:hypothetical protein [Erwinia tasmaniensis]|uniref:hypothetical protein n=1 Tax=Erwinia tasmaniensis TaxID=338565 RepID=UPI0012FEDBB8|nr:hypothetical protein [Erwinia tasmaniensis]